MTFELPDGWPVRCPTHATRVAYALERMRRMFWRDQTHKVRDRPSSVQTLIEVLEWRADQMRCFEGCPCWWCSRYVWKFYKSDRADELADIEEEVDELLYIHQMENLTVKRTHSQAGKYARTKGAVFERDMARVFSKWSATNVERCPGSGVYGKRIKGLTGDLVFPDDPPLCVELKRREGWTWTSLLKGKTEFPHWWEQTWHACPPAQAPVLVFKKNRGAVWIALPAAYFCEVTLCTPQLFITSQVSPKYPNNAFNLVIYRLDELMKRCT